MNNLLRQSTAVTVSIGPFMDNTGALKTSLTIGQSNILLSKNGGTLTQSNNSAGAAYDAHGYYKIPLDTTDTGTLGLLRVMIDMSSSSALPIHRDFTVAAANIYDSLVAGTATLSTTASTVSDKTGYALTSAYDAAKTAAASGAAMTLTSTYDAAKTAAQAGDAMSLTTAQSLVVHSGTAQGSGTGNDQIQLASSASATDSLYVGEMLKIHTGTGAGQVRAITAYTGSTQTATVERNWIVNPSSDSQYSIVAFDSQCISATVSGTVQLATTQPYYAPAKAGDAMTLTSAYDAAKTAAQAGDAVSLTAAQSLVIHSGTAQGAGTGNDQIQLASSASATDSLYVGALMKIHTGTGAGQVRAITAYAGGTQTATVERDWTVNPSTDSQYSIVAFDSQCLSATVSGNVTVGGYASGQDPRTLVEASGGKLSTICANYQQRGVAVTLPTPAPTGYGGSTTIGDVVLAASQPNYAPAKAGDAMTLTSAYDKAKTAAQSSDVPTASQISDAVLSRNVSNVESSSPQTSLATVILAQTNKANTISNPGYLTVYRTNGTTEHVKIPVTVDPQAAPIDGVG